MKALGTFSELLDYRKRTPAGDAQQKARSNFPKRVSRGRLTLRCTSEPIPPSGRSFIIGIATYAPEELKLLDQVEASLKNGRTKRIDVKVFDVLDCLQMSDFEKFIPGIGEVHRTPVIGVIVDGALIDRATGLSDVVSTLRRFHVLNHRQRP